MDCIFCRIIDRQLETTILYEDQKVLAFEDIRPQAPVHCLIIPKIHIPTVNDLKEEQLPLMGPMFQAAQILVQQYDLAADGYRLLMNCNAHGGQTVYHIHLHLLGGRFFAWPPG